jgi:hypothetical protein
MSNIKKLIYSIQFSLFFSISSVALSDEIPNSPNAIEKRFVDWNEDDLNALRNEAIKGDGVAANKLFIYYMSTTKTGIEGLEWLIIAVRSKNPAAMESFKKLKNQGVIDKWLNMLIDNAQEDGQNTPEQ